MVFRTIISAFIILLLPFHGNAQHIRQINGLRFEFNAVEPGTRVLFFDSRGYLWIGTDNGVVRFDGYSYHYFNENPMDSTGFKGTYVNVIFEDLNGGIWAATAKGVNYKSPGEKAFVNIPLGSGSIRSIIQTDDLNLWMTDGSELFSLTGDLDELKIKTYPIQGQAGFIDKLFLSDEGKLIGAGRGCYELNVSDHNSLSWKTLIADDEIKGFTRKPDGSIIMTSGTGIYSWPVNGKINKKELKIPKISKHVLHWDSTGILWFAANDGVYRIELNHQLDTLGTDFFAIGRVSDIGEDKSGNIFFGLRDKGFLKLGWNYKQYNYISLPDPFRESFAFKFMEDKDGNYWIGTYDGLLNYNVSSKEFKIFVNRPGDESSLPHNSVYGIFEDNAENIWIGTGRGVVRYNPLKDNFIRTKVNKLSHNITQDNDGLIWFIAAETLHSLDPENNEVTSHKEIQGERAVVNKIYIDYDNYLWAWYRNRGLQKHELRNGRPIPEGKIIQSLGNNSEDTNWIIDDLHGRLWLSRSIGVYVVDKHSGELVNFFNSANSPLDQDNVFELVRDHTGKIWLKQHANGSIAIDPSNFSQVSYNPSWLYDTNGGVYSCVVATGRDGKLFTDGRGQFCVFYPDSTKLNNIPPGIVLDDILINNELREKSLLNLNYSENHITFNYSGVHFDNPKKNRFAYFMEGYDRDWVEAGDRRQAIYSGVSPGKYSFYLKASNSDGIWSDPVLLSSVKIRPPWFRSPVAYFLYIILFAAILVIFYRLQLKRRIAIEELKKLNEIDDFKNQFFADISHEFRTPLTVILGLAQKIKGSQGTMIKRNADQLLSLINQILELSKVEANSIHIKNEKTEICSLSRYLLFSFSSLADEKKIHLEFSSEPERIEGLIDPEKYSLILQNLITNAIKFTPEGGSIKINIKEKPGGFEISVADTGIGISEKDLPYIFNRYYQGEKQDSGWKGTGIGLALTKQLVELMKGSIVAKSVVNEGSVFTINLPGGIVTAGKEELSTPENLMDESGGNEERYEILLIEDNVDVCLVIKELLSENYNVYTADNGFDGIKMAMNNVPDVIISDIMMPGKDGIEVTQILKNDKRTSHIPIILLTAKADVGSRLQGLGGGTDVYLGKPFNNTELLLNIKNLLKLRLALQSRFAGEKLVEPDPKNPEDKFIAYLQAHILGNITDTAYGIEEICRDLAVSRTQLHRKLKALTGKSSSIFIRDIRLSEGRKMIRQKIGNVSEVAWSVGFSDPNYFTRLYAERYGYPPSEEMKQ